MSSETTSSPNIESRGGVIGWFVRNPIAANLVMLMFLVGGLISVLGIDKKTMPEMRMNMIRVEVPFPGASPEEVERGILLKIEEVIEEVEGIKRVTSHAYENLGGVEVEVANGFDLPLVMDEVSQQIDSIFSFPQGVENPVIRRADLEEDDVILVQLHGELDEKSMTELFEEIRQDLLLVPEVSRAVIEDAREYEISIELSEEKLRRYRLTFAEVAAAIRAYSLDVAGGILRTDRGDIRIRTEAQAYTASDFAEVPLRRTSEGALISLGEVARIVDGFVEDGMAPRFDGDPSLSMTVKAVSGQNDLAVTKAVRDFVAERNKTLPDSVKLTWWGDVTPYLQGRINLMVHNLGLGAFLVFITLMLFLQIRLAFWVIVGIPVCFCGALLFMPWFGITVNMISLFGFILVLGIVVDDAIVIAENVHSSVNRRGAGQDSVIQGAQQVALPATFGVLTTIVAFIPMTRVTGTFGPIWMAIGGVVILTLIVSLVESKWILPAHLRHLKPDDPERKAGVLDRPRKAVDGFLKSFVERVYRPTLALALNFRYLTVSIFLMIMMVAIALVATGVVRFVFFPELPSDYIISSLRMAPGTPVETTKDGLRRIEESLLRLNERIAEEEGKSQVLHTRTRLTDRRNAEILVELTKSEDRAMSAHRFAALWSKEVGSIPGADAFTVDASITADGSADIEIELAGRNLEDLRLAGDALKERLGTYRGIYNVQNSLTEGQPELHLSLRPEAEVRGLTLAAISQQIREGFYGNEAQRIQRGGDEVKVMVRYPEAERSSLFHLEKSRIRTPAGDEIPFLQAVDVDSREGFATIQRAQGLRVAKVTAAADKDIAEPGKIASALMKSFSAEVLDEEYPGVTMRLAGASEQEQESMRELGMGFLFALLGIYALMAIPLRSYVQPLLIMSVIPFGFIGAVIGHLVLNLPFSVLSLCGIIALAGVVVNDSIVLVDFVNRGRKEGLSAGEAAREAGAARFRAILLTSLTTFIGLVPIIAERSLQAQIVIPMAVTLAFGILFATLITLFLLPTLYLIQEDVRRLLGGGRRGIPEASHV
ncbi:MAG: efflux RND transporter permease subunit [Verrucomicrobiota bacterium]